MIKNIWIINNLESIPLKCGHLIIYIFEIFTMFLVTGLTFVPSFISYARIPSFSFVVITYLLYIIFEKKYFPTKKMIKEDKRNEVENEIITTKCIIK